MQSVQVKRLLNKVLQPHITLAADLMRKVKRRHTDNSNYRYQVAAIVIFLAGVDKTLSLALQLLYLSGHLKWSWLKPRQSKIGSISCGPGLTKKLIKLRELGLDLHNLDDLIQLRNKYIHYISVDASYKVSFSKGPIMRVEVRPHGPEISFISEPLLSFNSHHLRRIASYLTTATAKLLEEKRWYDGWKQVSDRIAKLPNNPNDIEKKILARISPDKLLLKIEDLNNVFIGEGFSRVL